MFRIMFRMNGYVQDERYTAGAWMRRSGASQFCTLFDAWMCGAIVSTLHRASLSAWEPRSRSTFLQDALKHIPVLERVPVVTPHPSARPVKAEPGTLTANFF